MTLESVFFCSPEGATVERLGPIPTVTPPGLQNACVTFLTLNRHYSCQKHKQAWWAVPTRQNKKNAGGSPAVPGK